MLFKDCGRTDGRTYGRRRRRRTVSDHKSSPWAFSSGELKKSQWQMPGCLLSYLHFTNESVICAFQAGVSLHLVMVHQNCVHLFRHIPTNTPPLKNTTTQKYKYLKKNEYSIPVYSMKQIKFKWFIRIENFIYFYLNQDMVMVMCSTYINIHTYEIHMIIEKQRGFKWQSHNTFKLINIISKYWRHDNKLTISFQNTNKWEKYRGCIPK